MIVGTRQSHLASLCISMIQTAYGTEVQLVEVVNTYEEGEMDVVCVARQVFKVMSFENSLDGKLYAGGNVQYLKM